MKRTRIISIILTFIIVFGGIMQNSEYVSASSNISIGNIRITIGDAEYVYDGNYHSIDITIEGDISESSVTCTYIYIDEESGERKTSAKKPSFKEIGVHNVTVVVEYNSNILNGSCTVTITSPNGGSDIGGGSDPSDNPGTDIGDGTEIKNYIIQEYQKALNDRSGNDSYTIDLTKYNVVYDETDGSLWRQIQTLINQDIYSDYAMNNNQYGEFKRPDRYYVSGWNYSYNSDTKQVLSILINYDTTVDRSNVLNVLSQIENTQDDILRPLEEDDLNKLTAEEWILLIHDGMVRELDFAYADYKNGSGGSPAFHTNYGVLQGRKGLCDGYAYIFKDFMDMLGIDCQVMYSETLNHMWNMVKLDGKWYHVDCAWDDLVVKSHTFSSTFSNVADQKTMYGECNEDYNDEGYVSHAYFLKTDAEMQQYGYSNWVAYYAASETAVPALTNASAATPLKRIYTNVEGAMLYSKGYWYHASSDAADKSIIKSKIDGSDQTVINTKYPVYYLQSDGNSLYYTDGSKLIRIKDSDTKIADVAADGTKITEFAYKNGKLLYVLVSGTTTILQQKLIDSITWESDVSGSGDNPTSTNTPTATPTSAPTNTPTVTPTSAPTEEPTLVPTEKPTDTPTDTTNNPGSGSGDNSGNGSNVKPGNNSKVNGVETGDEFTVSGIVYEVTETEDSKEVAFVSAKKVSSKFTIPNTVTYKGQKYKVTTIESGAFKKNKKLTKVVIGKNIEVIEKNAFYGCKKLKTVQFRGKTPPKMGKNCFKGINQKARFKVPASSKNKYKKKLTKLAGLKKTMKIN